MAGSLAYATGIYYVTNDMHCNLIGRTLRSAAVRLLCSLFARPFPRCERGGTPD